LYKEHCSAFIDYLIKIETIDLRLARDYVLATIDRLLPEGITYPQLLGEDIHSAKAPRYPYPHVGIQDYG